MLNRALSVVIILYLGNSPTPTLQSMYVSHSEEGKKVLVHRKSPNANSKKKSPPPSNDTSRKRKFPNLDVKHSNNKDALRQWIDSLPIRIVRSSSNPTTTMDPQDPTLFLKWCERVLGIQTILKIEVFNYTNHLLEYQYNYIQRQKKNERGYFHNSSLFELCNDDNDDDRNRTESRKEEDSSPDIIPVRGLAASRDIQAGERLISIPLDVLISIPNTIDRDPILSRIMGIDARLHYGWAHIMTLEDGIQIIEEDPYYEIPLLAVAILYHQSLGAELSPLWNYISSLLSSPTYTIPFLLKPHELKETYPQGVRDLSLQIQQDVKEMYYSVMSVLMEDYGEIFGPPSPTTTTNSSSSPNETPVHMFSFDKFLWAFAIVNSHYWHLPVSKWRTTWNTNMTLLQENPRPMNDGLDPADTNMNTFKRFDSDYEQSKSKDLSPLKHSFLAPFADLLNFGPPCTHAMINPDTNSFDIVAVCNYSMGQEITFYYSDDCEDIIIANYGFLHPMIPKCPSLEDLRIQNIQLKDQVETLTDAWINIQHKLLEAEEEIQRLRYGCNSGNAPESENVETMKTTGGGMRREDSASEKGEGAHGRIRRITRRSIEEIGL